MERVRSIQMLVSQNGTSWARWVYIYAYGPAQTDAKSKSGSG